MQSIILSPPSSSAINHELLDHMSEKRAYFQSRLKPRDSLADNDEIGSESDTQLKKDNAIPIEGQNIIQFINHQSIISKKKLQTWNSLQKQSLGVKSQKSGFGQVWKQGALRIIYLISRFLQMVKTSTAQYKFKLVNRKIMRILGDASVDYQFYQLNQLIHDRPGKIKIFFIRIWNKIVPNIHIEIGTIRPDHPYRLLFDGLVLFIITVNMFYIPLRIAFNLDGVFLSEVGQFLLDQLPSIIFILEIVLNFITAYFDGGIIHQQHREIAKHYIKGEFLSDFIVIVPYLLSPLDIKNMEFVLLLRIFRITKIVENIEESSSIREKYSAPLDLTKLIFILIFVSHVCACIWNFIGDIELSNGYPDVWIKRYDMEEATWSSRYMVCFYWSSITTLTVGYGDLVPGNDVERLVCCVMVFICSIVFGYTISRIGSIFASITEKQAKFKNSMAQMNHYIKKRKLNKQLQTKVKKYFEYLFTTQQYENDECEQLMEQLSHDLKQEVKIDIYLPILKLSPVLSNNFEEPFLQSLCSFMHTKKYSPNELIFAQNNLLGNMYFIVSGEVQVYVDQSHKLTGLRNYTKGYVLGMKQFLSQNPINYSCRANQFVEVAYLSYDEFRQCLMQYPDSLETYQLMRDNLNFNQYYKGVSDVCQICSMNHSLVNCPFTFYQPNIQKIIRLKDEVNKRFMVKRRDVKKKKGSLEYLKQFQMDAVAVMLDNNIIKEEELNKDIERQLGLEQLQSQDIITQTIRSPSPSPHDASFQFGELPSLKIVRATQKKKSRFEDAQLKFPKRFSPPIQEQNMMVDFFERSESTIYYDMMKNIQNEFKEIIKEDSLPKLDQFYIYDKYFKGQNVDNLIKKINEMNHTKQKRQLRRYRKQKDNISIVRPQGSFMRASGLLQQPSSRQGNDSPSRVSPQKMLTYNLDKQDSFLPQISINPQPRETDVEQQNNKSIEQVNTFKLDLTLQQQQYDNSLLQNKQQD